MGKIELTYVHSFKAKGRTYFYYRRGGIRQRIPGEPGSVEFHETYQRIHASFEAGTTETGVLPGSFEALCRSYFGSPEFLQLKPRSQKEYRYFGDKLREKFGRLQIRGISRRFVLAFRDSMQDRPAGANQAVKVMRVLLNHAVDREWLTTNPAKGVKALKIGDGWQPWPEAALEKAHEGFTGAPRIAFMLAFYTGQRKGDILNMRWNDIDGDGIRVKQQKTGTELWIPLHPTLKAELAKIEKMGFFIVARKDGRPYTETGFYKQWRTQQDKLGLAYLPIHGLRKNATQTFFELGCTPQEVQAITGHASLQVLQHYGKGARQKVLAQRAMNAWSTDSGKRSGKQGDE